MELLIIKVTEDYKDFIKHLEHASANNSTCYYNTWGKNESKYNKIYETLENKKGYINTIFIIHENHEPKQAYICKSQRIEVNSNIKCSNLFFVDNKKEIVKNFISEILIDLEKNFDQNVYIFLKNIPEATYLAFINTIHPPYKPEGIGVQEQTQSYEPNELEQNMNLHHLAQRNEYCIRPLCIQNIDPDRSEFQRDRERIIHTKAYRRLVDKAQIFTSNKGDHYRTRMTHTLEVSQIARGISLNLKLNLDLTESIALGHDIGHTPFGHQGERTINDILEGNIDIIPNAKKLKIGGFNHNYQALRVLSYLEEKYIEHEGIDLSYQTLEGILKHTKCKMNSSIDNFLIYGDAKYLFLQDIILKDEDHFSVTLEGQVVEIADEIAQRGHDLDDAFAARLLNLSSFKDACEIDEMINIKKIINEVELKIDEYKNKHRVIIDETDIIRAMLVPKILGFLISDVVKASNINTAAYDSKFFGVYKRVDKKLITFTNDGKFIIEYLKTLISKNVINSFEVSRFDAKAEFIVKSLFKTYYNNPRLLPDSMLKRLKKEFSKISIESIESIESIDLRLSDPKDISTEIEKLTQLDEDKYNEKRKILARCIADHIGGMTDNYALNEYSKLYEGFSGHM